MYGVFSRGSQTKRRTKETEIVEKDCQARKLKEDAVDRSRWGQLIEDV